MGVRRAADERSSRARMMEKEIVRVVRRAPTADELPRRTSETVAVADEGRRSESGASGTSQMGGRRRGSRTRALLGSLARKTSGEFLLERRVRGGRSQSHRFYSSRVGGVVGGISSRERLVPSP